MPKTNRFRLKHLLCLGVLLCALLWGALELYWAYQRISAQHIAVNGLANLGYWVRHDHDPEMGPQDYGFIDSSLDFSTNIFHSVIEVDCTILPKDLATRNAILHELKHFPSLRKLHLSEESLVSLDFIDNLKDLKDLFSRRNSISELNIDDPKTLKQFTVWLDTLPSESEIIKFKKGYVGNQPELKLEHLRCLRKLEHLDLQKRNVRDLEPISNLLQMKRLNLRQTPIDNIASISSLKNLTHLCLGNTNLSDTSSLTSFPKLTDLDLSNTKIKNGQPLGELTSLVHLNITGTDISDVSWAHNLTNLESIQLDGTKVSDLTAISRLPKLKEVSIDVSTLSIFYFKRLKRLFPSTRVSIRVCGLNYFDDYPEGAAQLIKKLKDVPKKSTRDRVFLSSDTFSF